MYNHLIAIPLRSLIGSLAHRDKIWRGAVPSPKPAPLLLFPVSVNNNFILPVIQKKTSSLISHIRQPTANHINFLALPSSLSHVQPPSSFFQTVEGASCLLALTLAPRQCNHMVACVMLFRHELHGSPLLKTHQLTQSAEWGLGSPHNPVPGSLSDLSCYSHHSVCILVSVYSSVPHMCQVHCKLRAFAFLNPSVGMFFSQWPHGLLSHTSSLSLNVS